MLEHNYIHCDKTLRSPKFMKFWELPKDRGINLKKKQRNHLSDYRNNHTKINFVEK